MQAGAEAAGAEVRLRRVAELHGGQEATILSLNNVFSHWGCVIVPLGYTDDVVYEAGGNPYGAA